MNWVDLLRPIGFSDVVHRHDDEHLFNQRWELQNSPEYQILGARAQTFPLRYKVKSQSLGGIMTNRSNHSQLVGDIAELLGRKVGAKISRRIRKTMDTGGLGEIRTHHFMAILRISSLGHDLGSPPFAHPGEYAVREWASTAWRQNIFRGRLTKAELLDLQNFDANANAFSILANNDVFTFPIIASIVKYPNGSGDDPRLCYKSPKYGYLAKDAGKFEIIAESLGMIKHEKGQAHYARHPLVYLLEAADDIAYLIHDFRDALKAGFYQTDMQIQPEELQCTEQEIKTAKNVEQIFYYLTGMHFDDYALNGHGRSNERQQVIRRLAKMEAAVVDVCTDALARAFLEYEDAILDGKNCPSLVDLAVLPSGQKMGPIYSAIRQNFRSTVIDEVDKIRNPNKENIKMILDAFCMSYFSVSELKSYGTTQDHQSANDSLAAVKGFLGVVEKYDNQGEAQFSFESSFSDFIQDVLRWLCQQGDNDILRLSHDLKAVRGLSSALKQFQNKFETMPAVGQPSSKLAR